MKKFLIVLVVLFLIAGGYVAYKMTKNTTKSQMTASETPSPSSMFSSIQDAITRGLSLQCDYTNGTIHTVAYIKNGMVRADVADSKNPQGTSTVVIKDKVMYYWNKQMAFKMAMPSISITPSQNQAANTIQNLEAYKNSCHTALVADSMFDIPTGVTFQDMSKMMPSGYQTTSGSSGSTGGYVIPSQYQQQPTQHQSQGY